MLIHKLSARSQRPFLKVNCAAMPADLLESELFGYEQGAFTGAVKSKPGKFEICNNGTILLDEIGEMPAVLQAKLLQVLAGRQLFAPGQPHHRSRWMFALSQQPTSTSNPRSRKRSFREDLYYRLNGFTLKMPPLRERIEEIPDPLAALYEQSRSKVRVRSASQFLLCSCTRLPATRGPAIFASLRIRSSVILSLERTGNHR